MATPLPRRLPPLNAVKVFEAAARLGSFARAADELNVTHGAVSRQIRTLEDWLGVRLFLRSNRNAVPTVEGAALLAEVAPVLDRLALAVTRLRRGEQERGPPRGPALPPLPLRWRLPPPPAFPRPPPHADPPPPTPPHPPPP